MHLTITLDLDSAAFDADAPGKRSGDAVANALVAIGWRLTGLLVHPFTSFAARDANGNTIGRVEAHEGKPVDREAGVHLPALYNLLTDLIEWDAYMGGHEDPAWKRARMLRERIRPLVMGKEV